MTPSIPQPSYPGGGPTGTPPQYQPLDTSQILSSSQQQDLAAQQLMLQNFASTYPLVNNAQQAYQQGLPYLQSNANQMNYWSPTNFSNQMNLAGGAEMWNANNLSNTASWMGKGLSKFGGILTGGAGSQALSTIQKAGQGIYANPNLQTAYNTFTGEASGNQPINPAVQQQMMEAGLTNAAQNLSPTSLGTGQTGEANVARNFGENAQQYIQSMQQAGLQGIQGLNTDVTQVPGAYLNQLQSLVNQYGSSYQSMQGQAFGQQANIASQYGGLVNEANNATTLENQTQALAGQMFPKTQIGLTGTDLANMMIANTQGQNQFNQNTWLAQMQAAQYNAQIGAENAGLGASQTSGLIGSGLSAVSSIAMIAAFCWVARICFGADNPRWVEMRKWMLYRAPKAFREFYLKHGPEIAEMLKMQPKVKTLIRHLMESLLEEHGFYAQPACS